MQETSRPPVHALILSVARKFKRKYGPLYETQALHLTIYRRLVHQAVIEPWTSVLACDSNPRVSRWNGKRQTLNTKSMASSPYRTYKAGTVKPWLIFSPSCLVGITHTSASAFTSYLDMKHDVELVFSPCGKCESLPQHHRVWSGAARILLAK